MRKKKIRAFGKDGEILVAVQHAPLEPLSKLKKICGHSPEVIRNSIKKLTDSGVLGGITPLVNLKPLGYLDLQVFFSLSPETAHNRAKIVEALVADNRIAWVATLGGEFEIGILVPALSAESAWGVLEDLSKKLGPFVGEKSVVIRRSFTAYGRRHLAPHLPPPKPLTIRDVGKPYRADKLDLQILSTISREHIDSARKVAEAIGVAHATVDRRIEKLKEAGIIAGMIYRVNPSPLGLHTFRIMVATKGINPRCTALVREFCDTTPSVIKLFENVGAWDYEIEIDAPVAEEVQILLAQLSLKLEPFAERVSMYQLFRQLKYSGYPFDISK
jgi:DNA-binding Lrp family transcriptional regulator